MMQRLGLLLALILLAACGGGGGSSSPPPSGGGSGGGGAQTQSTISGAVTPATLGNGTQLTLTGGATATANASGAYNFSNIANGTYTVTPTSAAATFSPASAQVTVNGANISGINFAATAIPGAFFQDDFNGSALGSAWTVIERRGPDSQSENACNTASAVAVSGGNVNITTSATPATCGDAVTAPSLLPYTTGDIQWNNLSFTYGTVEVRAKFPPQNTKTWPAIWLLGANCQTANKVNGSEGELFQGCPPQYNAAYQEIDMIECDTRAWCHMVMEQGSEGWGAFCNFQVDAAFHVFKLTWTASAVTLAIDGSQVCNYPNRQLKGPMFLIMQTQTTEPGSGALGPPDNTKLPATFQIDYVKVTQP
jgi:beta-glucanase (GH16 family)